jgi:YggT family protein
MLAARSKRGLEAVRRRPSTSTRADLELRLADMSPFLATFLINLLQLLSGILSFLELVVVVAVVLTWLIAFDIVNVRNRTVYQIVSTLENVSDRLLFPIRRFLPSIAGIDFSPLVFLFLCGMVQQLLLAPLAAQIRAMS